MGIFNRIKEVVKTIRFSASPRLYGRSSAGAGEGQEIVVGAGLSLTGGTLAATFNETTIFGDTAPVNSAAAVPNFYETVYAGTNNKLRFTQVGVTVPTITFTTGGTFAPTSVSVAGNAISIVLSQNFGSITATANAVIAVVQASAAASALVTIANASGSNGTGAVAADSTAINNNPGPFTLSGGSEAVVATATPPYIRVANDKLYIQQAGIWKEADLNNLS